MYENEIKSFRKQNQLDAKSIFEQQFMDALSNLSRMGLDNSGFRTSLTNPAYMNYGRNLVAGESAVDQARQGWERLELMKKQIEAQNKKTGLGGLVGGLLGTGASLIPGVGPAVASALPFLGGGFGSIFDYMSY